MVVVGGSGDRRIDQKAGVAGGRCRKGEVPGKTPVCSLSPQVRAKHPISLAFEIHLLHLYQFVTFSDAWKFCRIITSHVLGALPWLM